MSDLLFDLGLSSMPGNLPTDPTLPQRKLLEPVPEEPDCYTLAIDNSSLELFSVCSRNAEYYMVHGREPAYPSPALSFGGALHKALECFYRHGNNVKGVTAGQTAIIKHFEAHPTSPDEYRTADLCLNVFATYIAAHPVELFSILQDETGPWVERSFRLPLGTLELNTRVPYKPDLVSRDGGQTWTPDETPDGFLIRRIYILWTGRIDLLIHWDGKNWVLDHKTTSRGGESFYDDFYLSQQMMGYTWAGQQLLSEPFAGVVVNAFECRRPTKTGKSIELNRRRYEYTPKQLLEWEHNTMTLVTDFLHHLARGYFPMETKWCFGKYGKCKYFDVCRLEPEIRSTMLATSTFRNVTWSPENVTE